MNELIGPNGETPKYQVGDEVAFACPRFNDEGKPDVWFQLGTVKEVTTHYEGFPMWVAYEVEHGGGIECFLEGQLWPSCMDAAAQLHAQLYTSFRSKGQRPNTCITVVPGNLDLCAGKFGFGKPYGNGLLYPAETVTMNGCTVKQPGLEVMGMKVTPAEPEKES